MNANELADKLMSSLTMEYDCDVYMEQAATMLRKQAEEIEYWKEKFNKAMEIQEVKPAKYSDAWWKEVEKFNKQLKAQEK
jgi:hypothetical protein